MKFDEEKTIFTLYIDNAKSFVQLSSVLLGLSVTFSEKIVGTSSPATLDATLLIGWISLLLSILAGALYQYLAVKHLDSLTESPGGKGLMPEALVQSPGVMYAAMFFSFYLGSVLLMVAAARHANARW